MLDHEPAGRRHVKALDWNENADDLIFVSADNQTGARCGRFSGAYHTASLVDAWSEPCCDSRIGDGMVGG
jgi:hypothetical protein